MKSQKVDTVAAAHLLRSFTDLEAEQVEKIQTQTLVLCGSEDRDNGDPAKLAGLLPNSQFVEVPGTHMSSVTKPELGQAMLEFLSE